MTMATDDRVRALASELDKALYRDTRTNGDEFIRLRDNSPDWMSDALFAAHGNMLPDDHRYEFIQEAANLISQADDLDEGGYEMEADVYNADLLRWLASDLTRAFYVDEAMESYGNNDSDTYTRIATGQASEKRETYELLLQSLRGLAETQEGAEETEEEAEEDE
jgi:hypothetical protein